MTKSHMQYATVVEVGEAIKLHCKPVGEACLYDEGWSDERIATAFSVTPHNVRGLREALMGKLHRAKTRTLEDRIAALEAWAGLRPQEPFRAN